MENKIGVVLLKYIDQETTFAYIIFPHIYPCIITYYYEAITYLIVGSFSRSDLLGAH
jgi:hypothetical protein